MSRTEAVRFRPLGLPLVLGAHLAADVLYLGQRWVGSPSLRAMLAALSCLLFTSVVWMIHWDPIEKILFEGTG